MVTRDWYTTDEAARELGLAPSTIRGAARRGVQRVEVVAPRVRAITREELERYRGETPMYVFCQAGAHRAHSRARLLPFAVLAAEVAVRRGALTLEAQDGEALAALLAADTSFFHDLLLFVPARGGGPCPYPPLDPLRVCA